MKLKSNISSHKKVPHGGPFSIIPSNSKILDFSSNISPLGISHSVCKTLKNNLELVEIYPDPDSFQLRKNLQKYTKIHYSQIVVGNGATELIYNFCRAFLSKKSPVLIPIPTFGEYEAAAKLEGSKVSFFKTMNLELDVNNFISKLPTKGCVFICNPNNPTGNLIKRQTLEQIIKATNKKKSLIFVDECFIELVPDHDESIVTLINRYNNLFVLRSLTKSFALAGLRIGYGLGSKQMISILNKIKIPWNVSGIAQLAASTCLIDPFYLDQVKKIIKVESDYLVTNISKMKNFQCNYTSTNFILIRTKINSQILQKKLLKKNILVRDCSNFPGLNNNYIRIAVKNRKENKKLIKALETL